jgi:ankyrin repeat protein
MNEAQQSAFELRLADIKVLYASGHDLAGCLLATASAHDPDPKQQADMIRFLVEANVSVGETDKNGVTPLHRAARFRSPVAVALLLELGADVDAIDKRSGSTPLHRAATSTGAPATAGKQGLALQIAKTLMDHGADPLLKNRKGVTPLDYAKNRGREEMIERLSRPN